MLDNLNLLGDGYLGLGQISRARDLFREGLRMAAERGARGYLPWFFHGLCGVARAEGQPMREIRLRAIVASLLEPAGRFDPAVARELALDEEAAATEWRFGRELTLEQAVELALSGE
jgi:hypothetical protein